MSTVDPPPAGAPNPGPGNSPARTDVMSSVRTMAVTAAVVAGTLLLGGYVVHEVTRSDHVAPTTPATSVGTSNGVTDPSGATAPDLRPRGRRGGGQFQQPPAGPGTGNFPRGRPAPPDATATTGRA